MIAAEVGINHNGDMNLARQMIDAAANAGADAVKFQNYRTESFLFDRNLTYTYHSQGREITEPQFDLFKRCELGDGELTELADHCRERGVIFFSTPTDSTGVRTAVKAGAPLLKNGSDFLQNIPLLREMAAMRLPCAVSTGMAAEDEITTAVEAYRATGGVGLILVLCTSSYPTEPKDVGLARLPLLRERFSCLVGFSDHTEGSLAAAGAAALGACFIEKHFTTDRNLPGPDHRFSADPVSFKALVESVRAMETMLGSGTLEPQSSEVESRKLFRLSCVAATDLPAGHILGEQDVSFCRPATGFPPSALPQLLGRKLACAVSCGSAFHENHFLPHAV